MICATTGGHEWVSGPDTAESCVSLWSVLPSNAMLMARVCAEARTMLIFKDHAATKGHTDVNGLCYILAKD